MAYVGAESCEEFWGDSLEIMAVKCLKQFRFHLFLRLSFLVLAHERADVIAR